MILGEPWEVGSGDGASTLELVWIFYRASDVLTMVVLIAYLSGLMLDASTISKSSFMNSYALSISTTSSDFSFSLVGIFDLTRSVLVNSWMFKTLLLAYLNYYFDSWSGPTGVKFEESVRFENISFPVVISGGVILLSVL